jgi:hypothetical protein
VELPSIRCIVKSGTFLALALVPLLLIACSASSPPAANPPAIPVFSFEQQLADSCGQPVAWPIHAKCVAMMGSVGPILQHRSDLIMSVWRSCPEENPCYRITTTQPACTGQSASATQPVNFVDHSESCRNAQEADYSCAALLKDPVYDGYIHQTGLPQDPYDCQRAKAALTDLDREVDRMSVRIQWYRVFAAHGY